MTDIITIEGNNLESEVPIFRQDNQLSDNLELPREVSFPSIVNKVMKGKKVNLSPPQQIELRY